MSFLGTGVTDAPLIAHSLAEAHCYLMVTPCGACGKGPLAEPEDRNADLLTAADLALVASGTATLEVAFRHTPMIVMYNASRWAYRLVGQWLLKTRQLSLVNILAGRELVPEFMPYYTSTDPIAERAIELLSDADARRQMSDALAALIKPLVKTGASENTARILLEMIDEQDS